MKMTHWLAIGAVAIAMTTAAHAQIYVTTNGTGTGASWGDATSLTNALVINQDGDEIWIAEGTHTANTDGNNSFIVTTNNVSLYGGLTNGMASLGERDPAAFPTVLDGGQLRRVLNVTATGVTLDGLVLQQGKEADGAGGSGLRCTTGGALSVRNCWIRNNTMGPGQKGAGGYFDNGTVLLTNTWVVNNAGGGGYGEFGIGLYAEDCGIELLDCVVSNNYLTGQQYRTEGGGVYIIRGGLVASRTLFTRNWVSDDRGKDQGYGAALYLGSSVDAVVDHCLFRQNMGSSSRPAGGGTVFANLGTSHTAAFTNCTFAFNNSGKRGGAFLLQSGSLVVENCILWSNEASVAASEILVVTGNATVDYTIVTGTDSDRIVGNVVLEHVATNNPHLASETDLHLKSSAGRYLPGTGWITTDTVVSHAIDEGDPADAYSQEPANNGSRVNLGRYGNTAEASKSPAAVAPTVVNSGFETNLTAATLKGELTAGTRSDITIYYGTNATDIQSQSSVEVYPRQEQGIVFEADVTGLLPETMYYYAAYATNNAGENLADVSSFRSGPPPPSGPDTVIHVDIDATGDNNGRNWLDAFTSVQDAIDTVSGDTNEIWIAKGSYAQGAQLDVAATLDMYGGFTGTETSRSQRDPAANVSELNGNATYRVMRITAGSVLLDGIHVTGGSTGTDDGGGIKWTSAGNLRLVDCTVQNNVSEDQGSGIYIDTGTAFLTNCLVNNHAYQAGTEGTGLYAEDADVEIVDCIFTNNVKAGNDYWNDGGGLYFIRGNLTVRRTPFIHNEVSDKRARHNSSYGAAMFLGSQASALIEHCEFRDNIEGPNEGGRGGTLYANLGSLSYTVQVSNCSFGHNTPGDRGGAILVHSGTVWLQNSILWSNTADVAGTEIYATNANSLVLTDYASFTATNAPAVEAAGGATITFGGETLVTNPLFASETDLHLKSTAGRWVPSLGAFTNDTVISPCIDAGDPLADYSLEPEFNGKRLNLGAYGNTLQASKAEPPPAGTLIHIR